jgi:hypothetical protein
MSHDGHSLGETLRCHLQTSQADTAGLHQQLFFLLYSGGGETRLCTCRYRTLGMAGSGQTLYRIPYKALSLAHPLHLSDPIIQIKLVLSREIFSKLTGIIQEFAENPFVKPINTYSSQKTFVGYISLQAQISNTTYETF